MLRFFTSIPVSTRRSLRASACAPSVTFAKAHFGLEMIHPRFQIVDAGTPLPDRLTPVYPTTAGLAQDALRKLVRRALVRDPAYLGETLPPWTREPRRLWDSRKPSRYLHEPPTDASQAGARRAHASGVDAAQVRRAAGAAALAQDASPARAQAQGAAAAGQRLR